MLSARMNRMFGFGCCADAGAAMKASDVNKPSQAFLLHLICELLRIGPSRTMPGGRGHHRPAIAQGRRTRRMPRASDESTHYGCLAGPICGARTGFAIPKKTTTP